MNAYRMYRRCWKHQCGNIRKKTLQTPGPPPLFILQQEPDTPPLYTPAEQRLIADDNATAMMMVLSQRPMLEDPCPYPGYYPLPALDPPG